MKLSLQLVHNTHQSTIDEIPPVVEAQIELVGIYKEESAFEGVNPEILKRKASMKRKTVSQEFLTTTTAAISPNIINAE